jgi:hypothetical protein
MFWIELLSKSMLIETSGVILHLCAIWIWRCGCGLVLFKASLTWIGVQATQSFTGSLMLSSVVLLSVVEDRVDGVVVVLAFVA